MNYSYDKGIKTIHFWVKEYLKYKHYLFRKSYYQIFFLMTFLKLFDVILNQTIYSMKTKITLLLWIISSTISYSYGQENFQNPIGGEAIFPKNEQPCISHDVRQEFSRQIDENIIMLKEKGRYIYANRQSNHPLFIWPVAQSEGFSYNSIWALTNYVDHDPAFPNAIQDYDCGTRSYDTTSGYNHTGYDIATWPFWWKQMELDQAINIAAADGQIVAKQDGYFDKNCSFNSDPLNGVAIQHSDGSRSFYFHFKNGGITSKEVGDTVVAGEFLGVIGSSGSSTGPHLHFEVLDSDNNLIDPSIGPCNDLNSDTWWQDPRPYYNPGINAALTHSDFPQFNTCPETEITNESDQFEMGDTVTCAIYLRDQISNTSVHLRTIRPDNSTQFEWDFDLVDDFNISWWAWQVPADMEGTWTWEVTYMDETVTHNFEVGVLGLEDELLATTKLYPNPTNNNITIEFKEIVPETIITISNVLGQTITRKHLSHKQQIDMEVEGNSGIYFVTIETLNGLSKTFKVIKN